MTPMIALDSLEAFDAHIRAGYDLAQVVLQRLDLTGRTAALLSCSVSGAIFLGCRLAPEALKTLHQADALVFPALPDLPFRTYRTELYTPQELHSGCDFAAADPYASTLDARIFDHWRQSGRAADASILETLCRRLHDHAITGAVRRLLADRRVFAVVGGADLRRDSPDFHRIAQLVWALTDRGLFCVSPGGPGASEAAHLGAYMAQRPSSELHAAIEQLTTAPRHDDPAWLSTALQVRQDYPLTVPEAGASLGVPSWLHSYDRANAFATHIAKYFASSVREDGLGSVAHAGIVFAPGGAETTQAIFQHVDAHLHRADGGRPTIFLGEAHWTWRRPVFPMVSQMVAGHRYAQRLLITDDPQ
ncbi:MAG: hypothetical protein AAFV29_08680, partial [Myxococcota bacterium]